MSASNSVISPAWPVLGFPMGFQGSQVDWVLGRFDRDERKIVDEALARAVEAIEFLLSDGIERAMNTYNTPPRTEEKTTLSTRTED